ncbi:MAG: hypothetical protein ACK5NT_11315 [Pyrinomonadaceae bacterium]
METTPNTALREAVDYYHSLMDDATLTQNSLETLDNALEEARLIFGGRRLSPYLRPDFIAESDWKRVTDICEIVFGALQKVKDAAINSPELLAELGVSEIERALIAPDPGYKQASPTARLDSFLTSDSFSYVELNGESPAGIAFSDSARDIFLKLPLMQKFAQRYDLEGLRGRAKLLDTLLACYEEYLGKKPEKKPTIAIVDLRDLPTVEEFNLCRDYFEANGCPSIICSPDELEFSNGRLRCGENEIDVVYRRLLVREYIPIIDQFPALFDAYKAGVVCVANSYRALILHKKAMFAVLTNEKFEQMFDYCELAAIRAHVPWTRNFREEETFHYENKIDLIDYTRRNAQKLVLKPNDDYGGHGIYIGWALSASEWDQAIEHAIATGDYLVQERVKTSKSVFPYVDFEGSVQMTEQMVDLDPLLFNGKVGSAFTRLSTTALANVSSGGGMVPTFILKGL